jgi:cation transport ATPase
MDESGAAGFVIVIVAIIAAIIFILKLVVSAIVIVASIVITLITPALVIYGVYWSFKYAYKHFDISQRALLIVSSASVFGISVGSLLASNWMIHTSIPSSVVIIFAILSGGTLGAITSYPYIKYLSDISNYRKKEQHLIKP